MTDLAEYKPTYYNGPTFSAFCFIRLSLTSAVTFWGLLGVDFHSKISLEKYFLIWKWHNVSPTQIAKPNIFGSRGLASTQWSYASIGAICLSTMATLHFRALHNTNHFSWIAKLMQKEWLSFMSKRRIAIAQTYVSTIETVQDFLIKLSIKSLMYLLEIHIFSLNNVIFRPTKIMKRANKNWGHF